MSLENGECDCSCHEPGEGSMHVMACCSPCPTCGKNVLSYHDCTRSPANSGIDWDKLDELEGKAVKAAQGNPQAQEFADRFVEQKRALEEGLDLQKRFMAALETPEGREKIAMVLSDVIRSGGKPIPPLGQAIKDQLRDAIKQDSHNASGRWGGGGEGPTLDEAEQDRLSRQALLPAYCRWCGERAHPLPCSEAPTKP